MSASHEAPALVHNMNIMLVFAYNAPLLHDLGLDGRLFDGLLTYWAPADRHDILVFL